MNKKKIFTLTGVIATVIALGSTAVACHFSSKKNTEQNNKDPQKEQTQNPSENIKPEDKVEIINRTMYGIPSPFIDKNKNQSDKYYDPNGENATVEKYGLPPIIEEDNKIVKYAVPPLLKYAVPKILNDPANEPIIQPMYAVPDPKDLQNTEDQNSSTKKQNPWK